MSPQSQIIIRLNYEAEKMCFTQKISYAKMNWLFCRNLGYLAMVWHFH